MPYQFPSADADILGFFGAAIVGASPVIIPRGDRYEGALPNATALLGGSQRILLSVQC
jgi:hypothetical protein